MKGLAQLSVLLRTAAAVLTLTVITLLTGCGTVGPVGVTPGSSAEPQLETPSATPPYDALQIDVFIDNQTVQPLEAEYQVPPGKTVVLVSRSDHDVTLTVTGPGIDERVFVARQTTITSSFVLDQPGQVTITTDDPDATIATLTVG
jgi:hypothetical protein